MKYYTVGRIEKREATYNIVFGERSNGKTYALLKKSIRDFLEDGSQSAYVRRWKEDVTGRRASQLYSGIMTNNEVERLSKGKYTGVHYWAGKWYLCTYDDNNKPIYNESDLMTYSFAISDGEHDKSTSFPNVRLIIFDEFLTNRTYLRDEFVLFMNVVSTIVRRRDDVTIYMLGNTVSKYSPYFAEMGLTNILEMEQGTIDVYHYGKSSLKVAVEYCASQKTKKASNKYFAFNNPKLEMITGGAWEMGLYPHLPYKYKPKNVEVTYYIEFNDATYQCEIISVEDVFFTFIHDKTTDIKNPDEYLIYNLDNIPKMNYNRNILNPLTRFQERVLWFYKTGRVFYQDNSVGDAVNNYIKICRRG